MKIQSIMAAAAFAYAGLVAAPVQAQIAGSVDIKSQSAGDLKIVALGYRASRLLRSAVYNSDGSHIGDVSDIIVTPNTFVSYVIVGVGGFLKIGQKDVAIPARYFSLQNNKLVLATGTKKLLQSLPPFRYSKL